KSRLPKQLDDAYYHELAVGTEYLPGVMDAVPSYTEHVSPRNLERMRIAALAWFFLLSWTLRPVRFFRLLRALVTARQESRLYKSLVEMKRRVKKSWKGEPGFSLGEINPY